MAERSCVILLDSAKVTLPELLVRLLGEAETLAKALALRRSGSAFAKLCRPLYGQGAIDGNAWRAAHLSQLWHRSSL